MSKKITNSIYDALSDCKNEEKRRSEGLVIKKKKA